MFEDDLAIKAVEVAMLSGASYADARLIELDTLNIDVKNGYIDCVHSHHEIGIGIRALYNGAWGFAANPDMKKAKVELAAKRAVEIAKASSQLKSQKVKLAPANPVKDRWIADYEIDPFNVPLKEKIELLKECTQAMLKVKNITTAEGNMDFKKEKKLFVSSEGSEIYQEFIISGAGISATSTNVHEIQMFSYPASFRGSHAMKGYEHIQELLLPTHAIEVAETASELLTLPQCPSKTTTLLIGASQLALQIHEACGHPAELDRVLGMEANFAGTSFLTLDKLGKYQYGSEHINIVADATIPYGLGSFKYDDEGIPAQKTYIIKNGILTGYLMNRETASLLGLQSNGTMRAESWCYPPIIRMTNINLLPGNLTLNELISDTEEGLMILNNRSWSIDDKRLNFQFGGEIGYLIKNGKIAGKVKNPTYTGVTPEFFRNCTGVAKVTEWQLTGTPNCGKGEPPQTMHVGHKVSYARFSNVKVGVGYDK